MNHTPAKHPPTVLIILDGFGLAGEREPGNAITQKTAPNIFGYMKEYPSSTLIAHGEDVGLFKGQEGNSEAGHFTIGAGRTVEQDLVRVTDAIEDGTFFKNQAFKDALHHAKKYHTAVHIMGLLTDDQSAHAKPTHLYALLQFLREEGQKEVYLHLFTDGRDSPPHSAVTFLKDVRANLKNGEEIATIMGRFYAMDRAKLWERTEAAYDTMVLGKGHCTAVSAEEAIAESYNRGETDEYICPTVIVKKGKPVATIQDNDVIYFFNARSDRARQITKAFVQSDFESMNGGTFTRKRVPKNIRFVAMTDFGPDLESIFTAFPSPDISHCLAKAIGEKREQLYISETEKYAHVTYFINGGFPEPINGEKRELVPSPKKYSYAEKPEMHARQVTDRVVSYINDGLYDFIAINYPNADMLGHTGDFNAARKGVKAMDAQVKQVIDTVLAHDGQVLITADHGNAEQMINPKTGGVLTQHTTNPVPCILIKNQTHVTLRHGRLADVAPTLLKMMNIRAPGEMTGRSLIED
ncbi:MAG: phosphoglycerate mutase (2,3-diphosphoglycerate-independent) [Candidatus Magasanikbacteria bacterium CG11_big_fil_rev_8_21_14_0_20_43_7]|uniref:2,3-bisphosphoglycerate-independent phosphoglycerate mutase n=1 Tax=Candidatus Magasanikbacteria bacterium CG11_big_fil_rev_8_21_14_0_20_43_7 TaxID=1974654 RepID=A0A2H0N257_9BACT|nr:MAG: phosphoglycerate mutase (2,3-diphosphoglycerate-independent) [Candidatus Magasanikbacteria bacterium CG11_big_fil_rev_8_21_14_0_20_43_7]